MLYFPELKKSLCSFLDHQMDKTIPGYFAYAFSGDVFKKKQTSNLAGSIFALKLNRMLGVHDKDVTQPLLVRILSFQEEDGAFRDSFICRKRMFRNILSNLKNGRLKDLNNAQYIRAETRQALSALMLYNTFPERLSFEIPTSPNDIEKFLSALDWTRPWGAGSHFSHLMFFLSHMKTTDQIDDKTYRDAQQSSLIFANSLQHEIDGAWYQGNPSHRQKVNGAMKVITGLMVDDLPIKYPERLIDLCLTQSPMSTADACDQINQILVLRYADEQCGHRYRRDEIQKFCFNTLEIWREYYYPTLGGFSFHKHRANDRYYGAKVSLGLNEPDIHGTLMFVWGLSMMKQLVPIQSLEFLTEIKS